MKKIKLIGEIGINHNGDINLCKKLIDSAVVAGFDYVKFQKRTPEICVPEDQKNIPRETPWGTMTYIDYKHKIEFEKDEYDEIDRYCKSKGIKWFASVWDEVSVEFMSNYNDITKIPSALITDLELGKKAREIFKYLIISTGMSTESQIKNAFESFNPNVMMHTNSTYPTPVDELNLNYINWLKDNYDCEIGYSGHEYGLVTTFATAVMGVTWIERHITTDRTLWGSDHLASLEPIGMIKLVKGIRDIEKSLGEYSQRKIFPGELKKLNSLRK